VPALPGVGVYSYDLAGRSSLGPMPARLRLSVTDSGAGRRRWTLDATNSGGSGMVEDLTVSRNPDGVYLSAYRLQISGGLVGVDLRFTPRASVLLVPDRVPAGGKWSFDLTSDDGCVHTHTVAGFPKGPSGTRQLRLATTATPIEHADCVALRATRVQDLRLPDGSLLPDRIDSDLSGELGGAAPASASYVATLRRP
jgi:hypothetical protein